MARIYRFPTPPTPAPPHRPPARPIAFCEVPGFLASASVIRRERPEIPREAFVAAGRTPADGALYTTPDRVLARVEAYITRSA